MKRFLTIILLFSFVISCNSQKNNDNLEWKEFISQEAEIKADFPCEVKKMFKSFQETPRPIHYFGFLCQTRNMTFEVWARDYSVEFDDENIQKAFEKREDILKNMLGKVESFKIKKDFLTNGFDSKYYELKTEFTTGMNELIVGGNKRYYIVTFGFPKNEESKDSNVDYESISDKFIKSFQVMETQ